MIRSSLAKRSRHLPFLIVGISVAAMGVVAPSCRADDSFWFSSDPFHFFGKDVFDHVTVTLAPEYFYWREEVGGQKFVEEKGYRTGLEFSYKEPVDGGWLWASRAKIYGGAVEYDGGLQDPVTGTITPLKSTTDYIGVLAEARFGYRYDLGGWYYLDVMGGMTFDFWDRHLTGPGAYDEYWFPFSAKAGVDLTPSETGWVGGIDAKVPFYTYQDVELPGDSFSLNPQPMITGDAQLGYQFTRHFSMIAFFESYWFRQSPTIQHGLFLINQPDSKTFEAGLKVNWTF
jgi:hypothetical protein